MATIIPTIENRIKGEYIFTWANMANGDVGAPADSGWLSAQRSVTVQGTFGVGGTVIIEEGNTSLTPAAADWQVAADPQGGSLTFTVARIEEILEGAAWMRPNVTAGDGTTSLTVRLRCYARPR